MRTLRELRGRYFSPDRSQTVIFGDCPCAMLLSPFGDRKRIIRQSGISLEPLPGLYPVLLASLAWSFPRDVDPQSLKTFVDEVWSRDNITCETETLFADVHRIAEMHRCLLKRERHFELYTDDRIVSLGVERGEEIRLAIFSSIPDTRSASSTAA